MPAPESSTGWAEAEAEFRKVLDLSPVDDYAHYALGRALEGGAVGHRRSLEMYSRSFLNYVRALASSVTVLAYCLWAFEKSAAVGGDSMFAPSMTHATVAVLLGIGAVVLLLRGRLGGFQECRLTGRASGCSEQGP